MKNNLSQNITGGLWMIASAFSFSLANLFVKKLGFRLPAIEIAFVRCFVQFLLLWPLIMRAGGVKFLATTKIKYYFMRLLFGISNMIVFYFVIVKIPMANAVSISYARPLFMVILAYLMLNETCGFHRILATIFGFAGVVVLIRPDVNGFNSASFWAVSASLFLAVTHIYIKRLSQTESPLAMVTWFSIASTITCLPFSIFVWVMPTLYETLVMVFIAILSVLGQYTTIKAFYHGDATIVSSLDYSQIVFASAFGILFLNEFPNLYTYIGSAMIIGSSIYILYREKKVKPQNTSTIKVAA
ncbi:MAG: DMT family transporter [Alphaproteobacteria bacterium]